MILVGFNLHGRIPGHPQVGRVRSVELSLRARRGKADHEAETLRFNLSLGGTVERWNPMGGTQWLTDA
jgi:hypothetical protein